MKKIMLIAVVLCSLVLMAMPAFASVVLDLNPPDQSTTVGGPATVELRVSGTYEFGFGGYILDIGWNPDILTLSESDVNFTNAIGDPTLGSAFITDPFSVHVSLANLANAGDVPINPLDTTGGEPIVLATLNFTGAALGSSAVFFSYEYGGPWLSDAGGYDILDYTTSDANVNVTEGPPAVPIPQTLLLFGSGLFGIVGLRRKSHQS